MLCSPSSTSSLSTGTSTHVKASPQNPSTGGAGQWPPPIPSSGDEIDDRACPERTRVPCVDLVQRNETNNPEAHGQTRKADGEAVALDCGANSTAGPRRLSVASRGW